MVEVTLTGDALQVTLQPGSLNTPVKVGVGSEVRELEAGQSHTFEIR